MTSRMAKIIFNNPFFRVLSRFFGIIRDCSPPPLFATLHVGSHLQKSSAGYLTLLTQTNLTVAQIFLRFGIHASLPK